MKIFEFEEGKIYRFCALDYRIKDGVLQSKGSEPDWSVSNKTFNDVISVDWEEVKQPYTFLEAYEDCEKNGTQYRKEYFKNVKMYRTLSEVVKITGDVKNNVVLSCKWLKED